MSAVLLELGAPVTDYVMIAFPRVILAHIALAGPLTTRDPVAEMKDRIDAHTNTALLLDKMQDVLKLGSMAVARVSGATDLADPVIDSATRYLVDGIKRSGWLRRRNFGSALKWFAAQDPRPGYGEYRVLVRLNQQAWSRAAGQDVDDLLVLALLADLSESMRATPDREANVVLLIDGADGPDAVGFLTTLLQVRVRATTPPDPLTVVATSGGPLIRALENVAPFAPRLTAAAPVPATGPTAGGTPRWVSVALPALSRTETQSLVGLSWPADIPVDHVVDAVHRVAAGHPTATVAVLDHLRGAEHVRASIDRPGGLVTPTTERDLLVRMVRGLCSTDPQALESLTTLAAARNPADAELLLQRPPGEPALLPPAVGRLLDVPALWTANDDLDRPAPAAFLRHLLLRRLAERGSGWSSEPRRRRRRPPASPSRAPRCGVRRPRDGCAAGVGAGVEVPPDPRRGRRRSRSEPD